MIFYVKINLYDIMKLETTFLAVVISFLVSLFSIFGNYVSVLNRKYANVLLTSKPPASGFRGIQREMTVVDCEKKSNSWSPSCVFI